MYVLAELVLPIDGLGSDVSHFGLERADAIEVVRVTPESDKIHDILTNE